MLQPRWRGEQFRPYAVLVHLLFRARLPAMYTECTEGVMLFLYDRLTIPHALPFEATHFSLRDA